MKRLFKIIFLCLSFSLTITAEAEVYLTENEFIQQVSSAISQSNFQRKTLWLNQSIQSEISSILGHPYPKLRLKYWQFEENTIWFLEEIGKEKPISFAVHINNHKIIQVKVLAFRESRGDEIKMQAFSDQFKNSQLTESDQLNRPIDGISGATMSVNAMKKISRVALKLAKLLNQ
ncbi:FMN-binding protein [Aliikangiella sp. IMCC44653]